MAASKTAKKAFSKTAAAEEIARKLPELLLEAKKLASVIQGLRPRNKAGQGTEFHSFVPYEPGVHDPRKIDYRSSARIVNRDGSDMLLIRRREHEVAQTIFIHCDVSKSMGIKAPKGLFPKQPDFNKGEAAQVLAGAIAYMASESSERFTILGGTLGLFSNRTGAERVMRELHIAYADKNKNDDLVKLPMYRGKLLPKNSKVFIFSDFLTPIDEIKQMIQRLHRADVKVHLIQILDPSEVEFRYKGHIKFNEVEAPFAHTLKKAETAKAEIEALVQNHIREVGELVRKISGWSFTTYITDRPPHKALLLVLGIKESRAPDLKSGPKSGPR